MTHEVWINVEGLAHPIKPSGVVIIDRDTGLPVPTPAQGLTRAQLDAAPVRTADTVLDSTGQPLLRGLRGRGAAPPVFGQL